MSLGQRISELRTKKKLSQMQLAEAMSISRQAVSKWETDQSAPDTLNLIRLADLLDADLEYLAFGRISLSPSSPSVITVEKIIEKPVEKIIEVPREVPVEIVREVVIEKPVIRKVIRTKYVRNLTEYVLVLLLGALLGACIAIFIK